MNTKALTPAALAQHPSQWGDFECTPVGTQSRLAQLERALQILDASNMAPMAGAARDGALAWFGEGRGETLLDAIIDHGRRCGL